MYCGARFDARDGVPWAKAQPRLRDEESQAEGARGDAAHAAVATQRDIVLVVSTKLPGSEPLSGREGLAGWTAQSARHGTGATVIAVCVSGDGAAG